MAGVGVAATVPIAIAQLTIAVNLLTTALVPTLTMGLDTGGGFRAALQARLLMKPYSVVCALAIANLPRLSSCSPTGRGRLCKMVCYQIRAFNFDVLLCPCR